MSDTENTQFSSLNYESSDRKWTYTALAAAVLIGGGALYWTLAGGGDDAAEQVAAAPAAISEPQLAQPAAPIAAAPHDKLFRFAYDKALLDADAKAVLDDWAKALQSDSSMSVTISGHADERGSEKYNLRLGERRAQAARNYLIGLGINAARLKTISYGEGQPAAPGRGNKTWAKNRRVEVTQSEALTQR